MKIIYIADTRLPTEMAHGLQIMKMCEAFASSDFRGLKADNRGCDEKLLYEELTYKIRGCVFNVYNTLGFGHKEGVYQGALEQEFLKNGLKFDAQKHLDVYYNNEKVGLYKPDFIIEDKVILEIKSLEFLSKNHRDQTLYYLKGTNYKLALLINFGAPKLQIKRLIFQYHSRESVNNQFESDRHPRKSTNNQCKSANNQRESPNNQRKSLQVELVVPWRFHISSLGKKDPFEYYKVDRTFKIKKIFCLDLTPLNRFLGPVSFLTQALSFSFFASIYLLFKKADIVYSRDRFSLFFISFFLPRWQAGKKNIALEIHQIHRTLFNFLLKKVKKIIVITKGLEENLAKRGIEKEKILIASDGIDLEDFNIREDKEECRKKLNLPLDKKIVLYTGHLYKWKGVETLALSSKFLNSNTIVVIVGGIKWYLSNFKKFVKKNNLKKVLVLGYQDYSKIPYYLKAADCLALTGSSKYPTSREYTSPMKMFEYMVSGQPIIASDLPSFREVLYDDQCKSVIDPRKSINSNAVLVEPDNPEAMANGIKKVLYNQELANKISEQAYKDVQKYTWDNRAKKILEFIK